MSLFSIASIILLILFPQLTLWATNISPISLAYLGKMSNVINSSMDDVLQENWDYTLKYFKELLITNQDSELMFVLVEEIKNSKYLSILNSVTSIGTLSLEIVNSSYNEVKHSPSISIKYLSNEQFKITYILNTINPMVYEKRVCHFTDVWTYLEALFIRLEKDTVKEKTVFD